MNTRRKIYTALTGLGEKRYPAFLLRGFLVGAVLFTLTSCEKNSPVQVDTGTSPTQTFGKVQGTVTDPSTGAGESGSNVAVGELQADGSLKIVSTSTVQTDASGNYTIDVAASGTNNLVVVATKGSVTQKALVSARLTSGATVVAPPVDVRTTVVANVYARLVADGKASATALAELQMLISRTVAAAVNGNASATAQLATAIEAQVDAAVSALVDSAMGASQSQIGVAASALVVAQTALDAALNVSGQNQSSIQAAWNAYYDAVLNAYEKAGISLETQAKARLLAWRALLRSSTSLSSEVQFALQKKIAQLKALVETKLVLAKFTALNATDSQISAVVSANATLRANVDAASTASEIVAAFDAYHQSIVSTLELTLSVYAEAIARIDADINGQAGFKSELDSRVAASATTRQVIDAYLAFYYRVRSEVAARLVGASAIQVDATTTILIVVNLY
jgi:hypothetical protein